MYSQPGTSLWDSRQSNVEMKKMEIVVPVEVLRYDELTESDRQLVDAAIAATERSYAPYSHFCVGAAIRMDNGEIVTGANQDNVAYPSGTCAERSACYYAGATYPGVPFRQIAIAARGTDGALTPVPTAPCGACRQALLEYETLAGADVPLLLVGADCIYRLPSVKSTLPLAFTDF